MPAVCFTKTEVIFILVTDWDSSYKFGNQIDFHLPERVPSLKPKPEVDFRIYGRHLEKSIWSHRSSEYYKIWQADVRWHADDNTQVTIETGNRIPIWRPSVLETASSFISAVDWDIWSKFGMQIYSHLPKQTRSLNLYLEVDLQLYGAILKIRYNVSPAKKSLYFTNG